MKPFSRITSVFAMPTLALGLLACSSVSPDPAAVGGAAAVAPGEQTPTPTPTPTQKELPGGGTKVFPEYRLVGYAGIEGSGSAMGKLGVGDMDERVQEMTELGQKYTAGGKKVMPTVEFIATVVQPSPGKDGKWRTRASDESVRKHLDAARKVDGVLLLAIQPGRADFPTEVEHYEKWLKEPDVGVALDPEWRMGPGEVPMRTFGHVTGKELDDTAAYLAKVVKDNHLPEKVMLYHQLRVDIVRQGNDLKAHPGVVPIVSIDGIGSKSMKIDTWNAITKVKPAHVHPGFKLFFEEDAEFGPLMTPAEVLALKPTPDYVLYE